MSIRTTSAFSVRARVSASKARPQCPRPARARRDRTRCVVTRPAAARSRRRAAAAARITVRPSPLNSAANLPIVVVLPEPLTPTTRTTKGLLAGSYSSGAGRRESASGSTLRGEDRPTRCPSRSRRARWPGGCGSPNGEVAHQHDPSIVERGGVEPALGEDVGDAEPDVDDERERPNLEPLEPSSLRRGSCRNPGGGVRGWQLGLRRARWRSASAGAAEPPNQRRMRPVLLFLAVFNQHIVLSWARSARPPPPPPPPCGRSPASRGIAALSSLARSAGEGHHAKRGGGGERDNPNSPYRASRRSTTHRPHDAGRRRARLLIATV